MKHLYVAVCNHAYGKGWEMREAVENAFHNVSRTYGAGEKMHLRRFTVPDDADFSIVNMDDMGGLEWPQSLTPSMRKYDIAFPAEWYDLWEKASSAYEIVTCEEAYDSFDVDDLSEVNTEAVNQ